MTGFKEGASDSPLDGDDEGTEERSRPAEDHAELSGGQAPDRADEEEGAGGIPWIYRRESIKSDRSTVQVHLQSETERETTDVMARLERQFDEDVAKADLREAALLVGLDHVDEVADQLREWGYDHDQL